MPWRSLLAAVAALAACAAPGGANDAAQPRADADVPTADAAPCRGPLELGRCVTADGAPCTGAAGEATTFDPLADGDTMSLVVGPQGSSMLVFGVRVTDMTPAGVAIELVLHDAGGEELARSKAFRDLEAAGAALVANGLYLVLDPAVASAVVGADVDVTGTAEDQAGARRCGARRLHVAR